MQKIKLSIVSIITASLLLSGCGDKTSSKAQIIEQKTPAKIQDVKKEEVKKEVKEKIEEKKESIDTQAIIEEVFKDVAKISPEGKQMILVFGTNTDPYTDKLKTDIAQSKDLQKRIKEEFSSYYLKAHENLRHKQYHEGQLMDVDTKTMIMVYGIEATPTIIFTDANAKAVLVVPGYIPTKQFLVTMDFMKSGKWKGKNRQNGEIYEALRDFYIENGIDVIKKKAK